MREIKFRIWHEGAKKYFDLDEVYISPVDRLLCVEADRWPDENPVLVLEQYTGLKDFNGADIYEGDILRVTALDSLCRKEHHTGYLEFEEFQYVITTNDYHWPCISWKCIDKAEVIGNIHENPELLEQSE